MLVANTTKLYHIRTSMRPKVSQELVARHANMSLGTYRRAEEGMNVTYGTATSILNAINDLLTERGEDPVQLDDLGLQLY